MHACVMVCTNIAIFFLSACEVQIYVLGFEDTARGRPLAVWSKRWGDQKVETGTGMVSPINCHAHACILTKPKLNIEPNIELKKLAEAETADAVADKTKLQALQKVNMLRVHFCRAITQAIPITKC